MHRSNHGCAAGRSLLRLPRLLAKCYHASAVPHDDTSLDLSAAEERHDTSSDQLRSIVVAALCPCYLENNQSHHHPSLHLPSLLCFVLNRVVHVGSSYHVSIQHYLATQRRLTPSCSGTTPDTKRRIAEMHHYAGLLLVGSAVLTLQTAEE
ncbi:hypothetical protein CC86DRAFT_8399 [Ophiobolus disseminans]|uniref:Uncharacterized protein n=1 Tax=Ophiobolus disseminans TaxID=1469910 RepID=A0A6A7AKS8_9PLEO|nr:hypothetical protein CC86DRAFT_8399 [Ophiobolus disseminans]